MIKCGVCGEKVTTYETLIAHLEKEHDDSIPKDFSITQYAYLLKTGKSHGNCVICKRETKWNEKTRKYHRFCGRSECKEQYVKTVRKNMIGVYGKVHLLNDPKQQVKMLANRSISGKYKWSDGTLIPYTGSYERDFLHFLDVFMEFDSSDIMAPSPHIYYYEYEGERKFYIPDFFIPSLNLEIEIKDGGDNPNNHHKIIAVDKEKERLKDKVLTSQNVFSYIKLTNKNYDPFFEFLHQLKKQYHISSNTKDKEKPIFIIREGAELYGTSQSAVTENAILQNENKHPVYILLTFTNTPVARAVRKYTGNPYSHASISFSSDLKDLYSFGRKTKWEWPSFISEDIMDGIYKDAGAVATYGLYVTFVTKEEIKAMKTRLEQFKENANKMKYSFVGLLNFAVGKETRRENEYFCSQFVAEILRSGRPDLFDRDSSLYNPYQLSQLKEVYRVTEGRLIDYDKNLVGRRVTEIQKKIQNQVAVGEHTALQDDFETIKCLNESLEIGHTYPIETAWNETGIQRQILMRLQTVSDLGYTRLPLGFEGRDFHVKFASIFHDFDNIPDFKSMLMNKLNTLTSVREINHFCRDVSFMQMILKSLSDLDSNLRDHCTDIREWSMTKLEEEVKQKLDKLYQEK